MEYTYMPYTWTLKVGVFSLCKEVIMLLASKFTESSSFSPLPFSSVRWRLPGQVIGNPPTPHSPRVPEPIFLLWPFVAVRGQPFWQICHRLSHMPSPKGYSDPFPPSDLLLCFKFPVLLGVCPRSAAYHTHRLVRAICGGCASGWPPSPRFNIPLH